MKKLQGPSEEQIKEMREGRWPEGAVLVIGYIRRGIEKVGEKEDWSAVYKTQEDLEEGVEWYRFNEARGRRIDDEYEKFDEREGWGWKWKKGLTLLFGFEVGVKAGKVEHFELEEDLEVSACIPNTRVFKRVTEDAYLCDPDQVGTWVHVDDMPGEVILKAMGVMVDRERKRMDEIKNQLSEILREG